MRTAGIRLIDDITPVRNAEVEQLQRQEQHKNYCVSNVYVHDCQFYLVELIKLKKLLRTSSIYARDVLVIPKNYYLCSKS